MANETELERLLIRFVSDSSQFRRDAEKLRKTVEQTELQFKNQSKEVDRGAESLDKFSRNSQRMNRRGIFMLGNALQGLANIKDMNDALSHMEGLAHGIGFQMGVGGMIAAAGIGVMISAAKRLNHEFRDKATEAANKGFASIIDGSKTAGQAIAAVNLQTFKDDMKDLQDTLHPDTFFGEIAAGFKLVYQDIKAGHLVSGSELANKKVQESIDNIVGARRRMEQFSGSTAGQKMTTVGTTLAILQQAEDMAAKLKTDKAAMNIGGELGELLKMHSKLKSTQFNFTEKGQANLKLTMNAMLKMFNTIDTENENIDKRRRAIGENPDVAKLNETRREFLATWSEISTANQFDAGMDKINKAFDKLVKNTERANYAKAAFDRGQAVKNFNLTMAGATKAELAFAAETDKASAALAYQKSLMQQAIEVHKSLETPMEKFKQTQKEMSQLFNAGVLSIEDYSRSVGKAMRDMQGNIEQVQGNLVGSAKAFDSLQSYFQQLQPIPKPLPKEKGMGIGNLNDTTKSLGAKLDAILLELQRQGNKPNINIGINDLFD